MMLLGLVFAVQSGILTDTRLAKPTDFDASLLQITDFCAEATATSGVKLSVDRAVQDLKVDVFVDQKPISETLDKVAKALNCQWVQVDKGYRLEMETKFVNRERNFNVSEDAEDRHQVEVRLWACEYVARLVPPTDKMTARADSLITSVRRNEILEPFRKAYEEAEAGNNSVAKAEAYEKYAAISDYAGAPEPIGIGRVLMQMDKQAKERFWKGELVMAATFPGKGYKLWPSDIVDTIQVSYVKDGVQVQADQHLVSFLAYEPIEGNLNASINRYAVLPTSGIASKSGGPFAYSSSNNEISGPLKKLPFFQDLKPWTDFEKTPTMFPQNVDQQTKEWPSPWFGGRRRLGEHLRWFHLATGIPIVAQADRSSLYHWVKLKRPFRTAQEYLRELMEMHKTFGMEDNGYFLARNYRYWTHRRHEASETLWKALEPKDKDTKISFAQILPFALNLREDQLRSREIAYPLSKIDLNVISGSYDMLRFYASLSPAQRQTAIQRSGLGADELSGSQQQDMTTIVKKLIFKSGNCSFDLAKLLFTSGFHTDIARQLRLHLSEVSMNEYSQWGQELRDGDEVLQKGVVTRGAATQYMLQFKMGENFTLGQGFNIMK